MVLIDTGNYIFLGVLGFIAMVWVLSSMGIVKSRNHELYVAKQRHLRQTASDVETAYEHMADLPIHARTKIMEHLDNGMTRHAAETAKANRDVYHFFKNFN